MIVHAMVHAVEMRPPQIHDCHAVMGLRLAFVSGSGSPIVHRHRPPQFDHWLGFYEILC